MEGKLRQILATVTCAMGSMMIGLLYVWPSYTVGIYMAQNQTILSAPMTEFQGSLLGGLPPLGAVIGTLCVGSIVGHVGRKKGGIVILLPFMLCWGIIEVFPYPTAVLIARFLGGTSVGAFIVFCMIFIPKIADDSIRGALAATPLMSTFIGSIFSYILGWFATYHAIIWVNLSICIIDLLLFAVIVESPVYLIQQKKEKEAIVAIAKYRGQPSTSALVKAEYTRLKYSLYPTMELLPQHEDNDKTMSDGEDLQEVSKNISSFRFLFVSAASRRALLVVATIFTLQKLMGLLPLEIYAKGFFSSAAPDLSPDFCSVLLAVVLLAGVLISSAVVDRIGRRVLLITSSVIVGVSMASLGVMIQTKSAPSWLMATTLLFYCFSFNMGVGVVPYVLIADAFHPEVKPIVAMLLTELLCLLDFLVVTAYPYLTKYLEIYGTFYIFAGAAMVNVAVGYFAVPETKGMPIQDIQKLFLRRRN